MEYVMILWVFKIKNKVLREFSGRLRYTAESLLDFSLKMRGMEFKACGDPATQHGGRKLVGI